MKTHNTSKRLLPNRRHALRASGVALALPFLESVPVHAAVSPNRFAKRLVAINVGLGLHLPNIVPEQAGRDYVAPPYLRVLESLREDFTFISGTSHPNVGGGHHSGKSFLTAARHPHSAGFKNSVSLDQFAAERLGTATRFRSLALSTSGPGLSWTRSGVEIPSETVPSRIFKQLFLDGNPAEREAELERLRDGRSILDQVLDQANQMQTRASGRDRDKLDQYMTSVREAEARLLKAEEWAEQPKPEVDVEPPMDEPDRTKMIERLSLMYDMMYLALETDSTRFITLYHTGMNAVPKITGVDTDYHMLSHHGKDDAKIAQLTVVETELINVLAEFLKKLSSTNEGQSSILDDTMVLFGSNLGNASSHDTKNMPIILAGGGFKHGQHLAFDQDKNYELPKLFVSMLQRLGLEVDTFSDSAGTMNGLEVA